jgi:hypothetical protein
MADDIPTNDNSTNNIPTESPTFSPEDLAKLAVSAAPYEAQVTMLIELLNDPLLINDVRVQENLREVMQPHLIRAAMGRVPQEDFTIFPCVRCETVTSVYWEEPLCGWGEPSTIAPYFRDDGHESYDCHVESCPDSIICIPCIIATVNEKLIEAGYAGPELESGDVFFLIMEGAPGFVIAEGHGCFVHHDYSDWLPFFESEKWAEHLAEKELETLVKRNN